MAQLKSLYPLANKSWPAFWASKRFLSSISTCVDLTVLVKVLIGIAMTDVPLARLTFLINSLVERCTAMRALDPGALSDDQFLKEFEDWIYESFYSPTICEVVSLCKQLGLPVAAQHVNRLGDELFDLWTSMSYEQLQSSGSDIPSGNVERERTLSSILECFKRLEKYCEELLQAQPKSAYLNETVPAGRPVEANNTARVRKRDDCHHSVDFRRVVWCGQEYSFTARQARVVRLLWEAWDNDTLEVGGETLLNAVDEQYPPDRMDQVFRTSEAWKTMICKGGTKGSYRLVELAIPI